MQRYIYIHGSPEATAFGAPGSHGCVRMRNADLIALFDQVPVGTTVNIHDQPPQDQKRLNQLQNDQQLEARGGRRSIYSSRCE
jgi:L,D-transpeptidase YbiS